MLKIKELTVLKISLNDAKGVPPFNWFSIKFQFIFFLSHQSLSRYITLSLSQIHSLSLTLSHGYKLSLSLSLKTFLNRTKQRASLSCAFLSIFIQKLALKWHCFGCTLNVNNEFEHDWVTSKSKVKSYLKMASNETSTTLPQPVDCGNGKFLFESTDMLERRIKEPDW